MSEKQSRKASWLVFAVLALLVISNGITLRLYLNERDRADRLQATVEEQSQSIGVLAGKAVLDFRKKSEDSYQNVQAKTEQALEQLSQTGNELLTAMSQRTETARLEMEQTAQKLLETFQEELDKFNQTMKTEKKAKA